MVSNKNKVRVNFTVNADIVQRYQRLSKIFTGVNWSGNVELFLAASVAYLEAVEKSLNEGKIKRPYDIRLPNELQVVFNMGCLIEEFEELKNLNLTKEEFADRHHDLLNSRDSARGSVKRRWEEAFDKVYSSRIFPVFAVEPSSKPSGKLVILETPIGKNEETEE